MSPRPWTPDRKTATGGTRLSVKRACESCGRDIGDATPEELAAAVAGERLPAVAEECGCRHVIEQLAMVMQSRDAQEWGAAINGAYHPTWAEIDPTGREQYLADAAIAVRVLVHLGYAPFTRPEPLPYVAEEAS